jgi:hypothetical protein
MHQDLPESLIARTVIGSLVRQLVVLNDDFTDAIHATSGSLDVREIFSHLVNTYNKQHKIYVVLDGSDLCTRQETEYIVGFLKELQEELCVLACLSLRQEPDREPDTLYQGFHTLQISSQVDNSSDIMSFVDAELVRCLQNGSLR